MAIEFPCPHCSQLLRVSDDSAGKTAKCPKCTGLAKIPDGNAPLAPSGFAPLPSAQTPLPGPFGGPPASTNPFSDPSTAANPYGSASSFPPGPGGVNPYASPQATYQPAFVATSGGPIVNQPVGVEPIFNYAWQLWQMHLGILLGATVTIVGISIAITVLFFIPQIILQQNKQPELAQVVNTVGSIVSNVAQIFLGIGLGHIALKLARGQAAEYTDLFGGGSRFFPILGASILYGLAVGVGTLLCIVPGILLALMWWPFRYLLIEEKAGIIESFSVAATITKNNWGTAFLLALLSFGIFILGYLALCIGVLFAAPLVTMLWAVAYLMMSGQLPIQPQYSQYTQFQSQQPPPKW